MVIKYRKLVTTVLYCSCGLTENSKLSLFSIMRVRVIKKVFHLKSFKANMISDGAELHMVLLIRMHVKQVHNLVGLNSAFHEEDKESTSPANL